MGQPPWFFRFFSRPGEPRPELRAEPGHSTEARAAAERAQHELRNVDMAVLAELPDEVRQEIERAMGGQKPKTQQKHHKQQKTIASFFKQRPQ